MLFISYKLLLKQKLSVTQRKSSGVRGYNTPTKREGIIPLQGVSAESIFGGAKGESGQNGRQQPFCVWSEQRGATIPPRCHMTRQSAQAITMPQNDEKRDTGIA